MGRESCANFLVRVFRCNICLGVSSLPAAACSKCENSIGCIPCVGQWQQAENACSLCRNQGEYNTVSMLREVQQVLSRVTREEGEPTGLSDNELSLPTEEFS